MSVPTTIPNNDRTKLLSLSNLTIANSVNVIVVNIMDDKVEQAISEIEKTEMNLRQLKKELKKYINEV